jgi:hypothetical protein
MTYRGFWILCRSCLFPVRLPNEFPGIFVRHSKEEQASAVLACPACGHVRRYRRADLKTVSFRIPDPFRLKKAVLYAVDLGCANRHCQHTVRIYAVAATTISVASLLELWKHWVIHMRCQGHLFRPRSRETWGIYGGYGPM